MDYEKILNSTRAQKYALKSALRDILLDVLTSMFRWENLPDGVRPEFIELYLRMFGRCAIIKRSAFPDFAAGAFIPTEWEYLLTMVDRGGKPDIYGNGCEPIFTTANGVSKQIGLAYNNVVYSAVGEPIAVICQNNNTETPDPTYQIAAQMLTEALQSLLQNIIHSRYSPVLAVSDNNIKKAVESAMADIIAGKSIVVTSSNLLQEIETGIKSVEPVPINNVENQQYIQYIIKTIDDVIRWYLTIHGQAVQGNGKMAQQTVDEVNGTTSSSFVLPELSWRWRNQFCEELREIGVDGVTVTYNKPWAVEVEKYTEDVETPDDETTDETTEEESTEGTTDESTEEVNNNE